MEKIKQYLTTALFLVLILGFGLLALLHSPQELSVAERRPLAQLPEFSWGAVENGTLFEELEDYTVDQFPFRDWFRGLKARVQLSVLHSKENNGLAIRDGSLTKIDASLNTASVENAVSKFRRIYETWLTDGKTTNYLAIIPDKSYFFAEKYGYPALDYDAMVETVTGAMEEFRYVDLFGLLELEDYYRTDTHWDQRRLEPVASALAEAMGVAEIGKFTEKTLGQFHGVYAGQSALNPQPDTIYALTNEVLAQCTVYDYETGKTGSIYDLSKLSGKDPYEVFLSGSRALLRIDNPMAKTDRQLIVFRDSFGSSLVPLLAGSYSSIVLVDIRYVDPMYLGNFLEFGGQDVLMLYSTLLLNDSFGFK